MHYRVRLIKKKKKIPRYKGVNENVPFLLE